MGLGCLHPNKDEGAPGLDLETWEGGIFIHVSIERVDLSALVWE
jgi:hypothetical protein